MASKRDVIKHVKSEVNSPKSRLIDLLSQLEAAGAVGDARKLSAIIGRLEAWQAS